MALAQDARGALGQFASPTAEEAAIGDLDCGCMPGPPTYSSAFFSAPPQSSYPVSFLAEMHGDSAHSPPIVATVAGTHP